MHLLELKKFINIVQFLITIGQLKPYVFQSSLRKSQDILNLMIAFRDMNSGQFKQVPLSSIANISFSNTYSGINRKNQKRIVTLSSNVLNGFNANEINAEIKDIFASYLSQKKLLVLQNKELEKCSSRIDTKYSTISSNITDLFLMHKTECWARRINILIEKPSPQKVEIIMNYKTLFSFTISCEYNSKEVAQFDLKVKKIKMSKSIERFDKRINRAIAKSIRENDMEHFIETIRD